MQGRPQRLVLQRALFNTANYPKHHAVWQVFEQGDCIERDASGRKSIVVVDGEAAAFGQVDYLWRLRYMRNGNPCSCYVMQNQATALLSPDEISTEKP